MITQDNIKEIIQGLNEEQKAIIKNTDKEYIKIELCISNTGSIVTLTPTNSLDDIEELASIGDCILDINDPVFEEIREV